MFKEEIISEDIKDACDLEMALNFHSPNKIQLQFFSKEAENKFLPRSFVFYNDSYYQINQSDAQKTEKKTNSGYHSVNYATKIDFIPKESNYMGNSLWIS